MVIIVKIQEKGGRFLKFLTRIPIRSKHGLDPSLMRVSPIENLIFKYELQGSKSISTLNVIYKEGGVCH